MNVRPFNWSTKDLAKMDYLNKVDYLVVHHTASGDVTADEIDRWHKSKGFVGCGYHYVVRQNGEIEKGRPDNKQGAQCYGYNNRSLGIVLAGNFMEVQPAPGQMDGLVGLLRELKAKYPEAQVVRHSDLCQTACPGTAFPWDELTKRLEGEEVGNVANGVPDWAQEAVKWAKDIGLINTVTGSEDFYRFIVVLFRYHNLAK